MIHVPHDSFEWVCEELRRLLVHHSDRVPTKRWHSVEFPVDTFELRNVVFEVPIPVEGSHAQLVTSAQQPWAEEHFQERVSGKPHNPPPSASHWLKEGVADRHRTIKEYNRSSAKDEMKYSHTYPERFWPKHAGEFPSTKQEEWQVLAGEDPHVGIRFRYGDLADVVNLLKGEATTRQAYLPVWFPEDTGAVHGERVPCTLGYHFLVREGQLHISYFIRSVDFVRHFRDDVYLAMRLGQWMCGEMRKRNRGIAGMPENATLPTPEDRKNERPMPGSLTMHIVSLHAFEPDMKELRSQDAKGMGER